MPVAPPEPYRIDLTVESAQEPPPRTTHRATARAGGPSEGPVHPTAAERLAERVKHKQTVGALGTSWRLIGEAQLGGESESWRPTRVELHVAHSGTFVSTSVAELASMLARPVRLEAKRLF